MKRFVTFRPPLYLAERLPPRTSTRHRTLTATDSFVVDCPTTHLEYRISVMTTMMITISLPEGRVVQPRRVVPVASGSVHNSKRGAVNSLNGRSRHVEYVS